LTIFETYQKAKQISSVFGGAVRKKHQVGLWAKNWILHNVLTLSILVK